jgi:hypothetical protein
MTPCKAFFPVGNDISDGFHTFAELYEHRTELFLALCRFHASSWELRSPWRSRQHADGAMYEGWFIMGIGQAPGEQIPYHLPLDRWEETNVAETLDRAPEWDGHTPADVLQRLKRL